MADHTLDITKRGQIERAIADALKCAIDSHGPITIENRHSAAKRVYCALKEIRKTQKGDLE